MLKYNISDIDISVDANNKVYILGVDSAEGKPYLYSLLKSLQQRPEYRDKLLLVTYNEDMDISKIVNKIDCFTGDIIMMDRVDLYWCEDLRNILKQKKKKQNVRYYWI